MSPPGKANPLRVAKYLVAVAAAVVTVGAAARALGVTVEWQTRAAAAEQHEEIKNELRAEQRESARALEERLDRGFESITNRLDRLIEGRKIKR